MAGRGFGKTRTGTGWTHEEAMREGCHIALVARNPADFRDYMWDGPGGFRRNCPMGQMPTYQSSVRRVTWPNGSIGTIYSGEDPEAIRGFSGSRFWIDEFAKFRYPEDLWDNLQFGMREVSVNRPRGLITTTPRPSPILRKIIKLKGTVKVVGTTYENRNNLDPAFFETTIKAYEGTRLGRQEIQAEILDDVQGALWTRAMIDKARAAPARIPDMSRIVVAIDPSGARGADDENANSIGIVVAGRGVDGRGYILADRSCKLSPAGWARRALLAYNGFSADRIIAERNFGGAMVESTIKLVAEAMEPPMIVSYSEVVASRGKVQRAEPVAALYEQGRVSHIASDTLELVELEDQLCLAAGTRIETSRGQTPIEDVRRGDLVATRNGLAPVRWAGRTGVSSSLVRMCTPSSMLEATPCHPVFVQDKFVSARHVRPSDSLRVSPRWGSTASQWHGAGAGITGWSEGISGTLRELCFIEKSMKAMLDRSLLDGMSITSMAIPATTVPRILSASVPQSTIDAIRRVAGISQQLMKLALAPPSGCGQIASRARSSVWSVVQAARRLICGLSSTVQSNVSDVHCIAAAVPVYNLQVEEGFLPEYFANGILVHNCQMTTSGYLGEGSPDRVDADVWALTELMLPKSTYDSSMSWVSGS
jgi:phage terminase large subunit-like protein